MRLIVDNRESEPFAWAPYFSPDVRIEWGTLETGDLALAALPDAAVVERKTVPDLLGCIGASRDRFERELRRGRYVGRLIVIVEGSLADVLRQSRGIHPNAILGTVAAWQRRFCPICFAGDVPTAARVAESFLRGQVKEWERTSKAMEDAA